MPKQTTPVEWYVAESDADWQRLCAPPRPDPALAAHRRLPTQHFLGGVALLLCLLVVVWWWRTDGDPLSAEGKAAAQQETGDGASDHNSMVARNIDPPSTLDRRRQGRRELSELSVASATAASSPYAFDAVQNFEVQGDQALGRVVMYTEHGESAYRQTRFYLRMPTGWIRTDPDADLWGGQRSLETPFFVYHFRQHDAPVVIAVAPQIEALYTTLRGNFGLTDTPQVGQPITSTIGQKLAIEVSVTQTPGSTRFEPHNYERFVWEDRLIVASPALYLAPVDLTDEELLAQSVALPLIADVLAQASEHYQFHSAWQPLVSGLYLWHVWDLDLPLAGWREEVVTWVYADLPNPHPGQAVVLPERYTALCAAHKLWMPSPAQINIPLLCAEVAWEDFYLSPWGWYDPLTHLNQLGVPLRPGEYLEESASLSLVRHPGRTVALTTLIEYAVATYGRERLPALVAGLGQHASWDTLLPAVFGVSPAAFEAGWQAYLAAHYAVPYR